MLAANRLNPLKREIASAFYFWLEECSEAGREARFEELEWRVGKMTRAIEMRDKEIKRLKLELQLASPETQGEQAAREKREKQIKAMQKRQAAAAAKKAKK